MANRSSGRSHGSHSPSATFSDQQTFRLQIHACFSVSVLKVSLNQYINGITQPHHTLDSFWNWITIIKRLLNTDYCIRSCSHKGTSNVPLVYGHDRFLSEARACLFLFGFLRWINWNFTLDLCSKLWKDKANHKLNRITMKDCAGLSLLPPLLIP